jgi:hypothetical protein
VSGSTISLLKAGRAKMKPEDWIAIYAAIVGTAALVLNFRAWFEKRVRLTLSLMPDAILIGAATARTRRA